VRVAACAEDFEAALAAGVSDARLAEYAARLDKEVSDARDVIQGLIEAK